MGVQAIADVYEANLQVVRKELRELYENGGTTYNLLKKQTDATKISKTEDGKDFRIPLEIQPTGNFAGFNLANGALGQGQGFKMKQQYQGYYPVRLAVSMDQDSILATQTSEQSRVNVLKRNTAKAMPNMLRYCNTSFLNQGGAQGLVAKATGYSGGTFTFDTEFGANHLQVGQPVEIFDSTLATWKTYGLAVGDTMPYIDNINKQAGTAHITNLGSVSPAATDYLAFPGVTSGSSTSVFTAPAWMNTLRYFHSTAVSGNLLGLSLANYAEIRPNWYDAQSGYLVPEMGDILKSRIRQRRGSLPTDLTGIVHDAQVGQMKKLNMAIMKQDRTPGAAQGLVDLMPSTADEVTLWGIKHKIDVHQSKSKIDWLALKNWGRVYAQELDWWKNPGNGTYFFEGRNSSGGVTASWSMFLYVVENFYNVDLGWEGFITGLSIPAGY